MAISDTACKQRGGQRFFASCVRRRTAGPWKLLFAAALATCFGPEMAAGKSAADKLKAGDTAMAGGQNNAAVKHYTDALEIDARSPLIHTKRAAAYIALKRQQDALKDLTKALDLDPKMVQALLSRGKIHRMLGRFSSAEEDFKAVLSLKPSHKAATQELNTLAQAKDALEGAKRHLGINDIRGAEMRLKTAAPLLPDCPELLMLQSDLAYKRRDYGLVITELGKLLKLDSGNIAALIMRGWAYLQTGEEETGIRHFREAIRFDPEHKEAKAAYKKVKSIGKLRQRAQEAMAKNDFRSAEAAYREASQVDPSLVDINIPFVQELCSLQLRMGKAAEALESCQRAVQLNPQLLDCAVNRVRAMIKLERFDEAVNVARTLAQQHRTQQVHQVLQEAERALKISKQKDYYKILGVDRRADEAAIKKQYRALARKYHPDKAQGDEAEKAAAENKFREVAEAYEVLTDPEKRSRFDRGEDLDQPAGHGGWPGGHHNQHYQQRGGW
eukprot:jgi/Tetstr1/438114/TSEL_026737.t1